MSIDPTGESAGTEIRAALAALADLVLSDLPLSDVLSRVVDLASDVVPGADAVSVTVLDAAGGAHSEAFTGPMALALDEWQYEADEGPCLQAARTSSMIVVDDMAGDLRWPEYTPHAVANGALSSLSVGMPQRNRMLGCLNIYGSKPHAFDQGSVEIAAVFAGYATAALAKLAEHEAVVELADQLTGALESRAVIEQAKGVLVAQQGCSPDAAFDMMRTASQNYNRKLRDIAVGIVERAQADRPAGAG